MKLPYSLTAITIFSVLVFSQAFQCSQVKKFPYEVTSEQAYVDTPERMLGILASDSLEGRGTGTIGEQKAANYIVSQFSKMGLTPKGENGTWFQTFTFTPHPPMQKHQVGDSVKLGMGLVKEISGKNVIAFLDNGAANTVVIGAHYDHLGWGDENSLHTGERAIHNGADDNASGVTVMLQVADRLKKSNLKNNNYLFIAFSGEEKGLWGSNFFTKNPTITNMNYMINMDMVGRLNKEKSLAISGIGTAPVWKTILESENTSGLSLVLTESGVGPSDHTSFYNIGIPAIHLFTGQHEDYHKPADDADKINYAGVKEIIDYTYRVVAKLDKESKLTFQKTKDESTASAADFKVTLGVVPDYLYSGEGMRIDGVKEGRPAAKAGMKQGDVVISIGENKISDMYSYMDALSKFEKGQSTDVVIERAGVRETVKVTWE